MKTICTLVLSFLLIQSSAFSQAPIKDFTSVAKEAIPAVVSISVKGVAKSSRLFDSGSLDPQEEFWSRFFGLPTERSPREEILQGQASGFLISPDGTIITNSHVVDGMKEIKVKLNDGREFKGTVLGHDPNTDVAIVKIDAKNLPFLKLGDSDKLEVGQWVVAIGNPLGLQASLTVGVVSATGRNDLDLAGIEDFIQTDAAINRGNSGGPLLNLDAEVIGINTAIVSNVSTGGYMGIGFAVPSNIAKFDMAQILEKGSVSRGFLGVTLQQMDEDLAQAFGLDKPKGVLVSDVIKESPAAKAGIKQGDVILKLNQQPVVHIANLRNSIALMPPGSTITLTILHRDKTTSDIKVNIGDYAEAANNAKTSTGSEFGITVQNLTQDLQAKTEGKGVVVSKVEPGSLAALAGIKKDAIIVGVNHQEVSSVDDYMKAIKSIDKNKPTVFLIKQGDAMRYVSLKES